MDQSAERLLTPSEVAELFRVDPKTVTRWAAYGQIGFHPHPRRPSPVPRDRDPPVARRVDRTRRRAPRIANQPSPGVSPKVASDQ